MFQESRIAPPGRVWVCMACGKKSPDRRGDHPEADWGWDVSCITHAALCDLASLEFGEDGRVSKARAVGLSAVH